MSREYKFKIDAYSPDTIPMARLAEYLSDLASLMGFRSGVHFSHLEEGSVVVVQKVDYENIPKVEQRIRSANRGDGPKDAMTAIRSLDRRLSDDNAVGHLLGARDHSIPRQGAPETTGLRNDSRARHDSGPVGSDRRQRCYFPRPTAGRRCVLLKLRVATRYGSRFIPLSLRRNNSDVWSRSLEEGSGWRVGA